MLPGAPLLVLYSPAVLCMNYEWMSGLHQDYNRIVDCSLCLLWLNCVVEIELGSHGAGKLTVFECLALSES